ncbi:MAG TPA: class I SAM-dependent methyltransferase [Candidatus Andersenbacteria bacterium]|nr:class I SAM-dependent methyltransferase [Candidatus Andersenbacteria bacterium]
MKPSTIEDARYATQDYCQIRREEEIIFSYLDYIKHKQGNELQLLDIGCGSGMITKEIANKGFQVKGIDFSKTAVEKARAAGVPAEVVDLDDGIPDGDNTYDVVLAGDIIEHVFDPMSVIREASRVVKPGGYFLVTIPNDVSVMVRIKTLLGISYQEVMYRRSGIYKHHTFFTLELLRYMLRKAGFSIVKKTHITNIGRLAQLQSPVTPLLFTNELVVMAQKSGVM